MLSTYHGGDPVVALPSFDLSFSLNRKYASRNSSRCTRIQGPLLFCGAGSTGVVSRLAIFQVLRMTDVEATGRAALKHIDRELHERNLVEVRGLEPLTPCLQSRCSPN